MKSVQTQIRIHIHKQLLTRVHNQLRNQVSIRVSTQIYDQLYEQVRGGQVSFMTKHNMSI